MDPADASPLPIPPDPVNESLTPHIRRSPRLEEAATALFSLGRTIDCGAQRAVARRLLTDDGDNDKDKEVEDLQEPDPSKKKKNRQVQAKVWLPVTSGSKLPEARIQDALKTACGAFDFTKRQKYVDKGTGIFYQQYCCKLAVRDGCSFWMRTITNGEHTRIEVSGSHTHNDEEEAGNSLTRAQKNFFRAQMSAGATPMAANAEWVKQNQGLPVPLLAKVRELHFWILARCELCRLARF